MLICFDLKSFIFSSAFVDTVCSQCVHLERKSFSYFRPFCSRLPWLMQIAMLLLDTGFGWSLLMPEHWKFMKPKPGARGLLREPIWLSLYRGCGKDCWSRTGFECWVGGPPAIFCAFQIFQVFLLCTCLQFFSRSQSYSLQIFTSN